MASTLSLPQRTEILIIGGGPAGLAAALSLRKQGCTDIVVVDDVLQEAHTSRAITMHAATLDAIAELGCADEIVAESIKATRGVLWDGSSVVTVADFSALKGHTRYPFLSLVPQFVTERVLTRKAVDRGIRMIWPLKVVGLKANKVNAQYTDVTFEDGQVVEARYVVGADGAKSTVREAAGITYKDPDGENDDDNSELRQAIVADVVFDNPPPVGSADFMFIISNENIWLCLPLPPSAYDGQQVWRIAIGHPIGVPPHAPDTAFLQGVVDAYGPSVIPPAALPLGYKGPLKIAKTIWSSRFRTSSAISSTHFTRMKTAQGGEGGIVVLVGDAAHKHPPVGGQGMNLGLRDAVSLGPVLATHIKQCARPALVSQEEIDEPLRAWATIRHERALKVIQLTKTLLTSIRWKNEIIWYKGIVPVNLVKLRQWLMWLGGIIGYTQTTAAWQLSGLQNR